MMPPVPGHLADIEFMRVLTTYVSSAELAASRRVLDAGCGTGHGSWLMRERGARSVLAVDLDPANVAGVRGLSREDRGIHAALMDAQALGLAAGTFDLIVCFEVIEHVPDPARLLSELRRVAAAGSLTLLSTPNRLVRLAPGERPFNPEHLREYDLTGFRAALERTYARVEVLGIVGRGAFQERYLREWRPTFALRARRAVRDALPIAVQRAARVLMARLRERARSAAPREIAAPAPGTWPFYVDDASERCLNLFALCADDTATLDAAVTRIRASARGASGGEGPLTAPR